MRKSLTKKERLKKKDEFQRVFRSPTQFSCAGAKLALASNSLDKSRLGVGLYKKFGNAVERNRAKRQVREIFRLHKQRVKPGFDLVFLIFPGNFSYAEREKQYLTLLHRSQAATPS